ncbi:MAG TPA: FAD-dependent monooxygenase [Longimicrobiaceae bacterium]
MDAGKALVVGGGIGGLAAAVGLRRAGWEVEVLERAPEIREVGAGLTLWDNALRALDRLGMGELVERLEFPEGTGGIWSWRGELLLPVSPAEVRERYGQRAAAVHRAELQAALLDALGRDRVRTGAECTGFREDAHGVVAELADGGSARGDVLVGADGLRSVVRAALHGAEPPVYAGYTAWRGVVEFPDTERLRPGESWGAGTRFGRVPLSDGRAYWFAVRDAPEGERAAGGEKAELLRLFGGWHEPVRELVEATPEEAILRGDVYDRPTLRSWGRGRATLLGDAAHPMTPNLGQGACQALEDAAVLAQCLAGEAGVPEALRAYEARRVPRANAFVERSRAVGRVAQWSHPLAVGARMLLVRHLLPRLQGRQYAGIAASGL